MTDLTLIEHSACLEVPDVITISKKGLDVAARDAEAHMPTFWLNIWTLIRVEGDSDD